VGMQTIRFQSENYVARTNFPAVDDIAAVHNTNNATGEIVFALAIHSGHLSCLAADQSAICRPAGARKTAQQFLEDAGFELPAADVIEEEKGTRTHDCDVVYAMVNQIGADGIMLVQSKRDF